MQKNNREDLFQGLHKKKFNLVPHFFLPLVYDVSVSGIQYVWEAVGIFIYLKNNLYKMYIYNNYIFIYAYI